MSLEGENGGVFVSDCELVLGIFFAGLSAVSLFLFVFSVNKFINPGFMLANAAIVVGVLPLLYAVGAAAAAISTRQPIMLLVYLVLWPFQMVRVLSQHSIISGVGSVSQFIAKDKRYEVSEQREKTGCAL